MNIETRNLDRWNRPHFAHESMTGDIHSGIHTVLVNGLNVDFIFRSNGSSDLVVWFAGAAPMGEKPATLPYFAGVKLADEMDDHDHLCIADPSLTEELRLGWYVGTSALNQQDVTQRLVDWLVEAKGYRRVIYVGSSGGGFAALEASSRRQDSLAITSNPQTQIDQYYKGHIERFRRRGFPDVPAVQEIEGRTVSLLNIDSRPMVYLQNVNDDFHINAHAKPYFSARGYDDLTYSAGAVTLADHGIALCTGDWGKAHTAPPRGVFAALIRAATAYPGPLEEFVSSGAAAAAFSKAA